MREEISSLQHQKFFIPFVAIVESWLRPEIADAQINITGFNVFRQDREKTLHGGVLLYINDKLVVDKYDTFNDDS